MDKEKEANEEEEKEKKRCVFLAEAKKTFLDAPSADKKLKLEKWLELAETFEEIQEVYKASLELKNEDMRKAAKIKLIALIRAIPWP